MLFCHADHDAVMALVMIEPADDNRQFFFLNKVLNVFECTTFFRKDKGAGRFGSANQALVLRPVLLCRRAEFGKFFFRICFAKVRQQYGERRRPAHRARLTHVRDRECFEFFEKKHTTRVTPAGIGPALPA